jgi:electron transfer flavoprotein beta subunit
VPFSPSPDQWGVAEILQAVVLREQPQLVIMGKQAADDDACQVGPFLAARLDWPQATFASRIQLVGTDVIVDREIDNGVETIRIPLPVVITVGLRLNEPRYASLAGIMKARKTPLELLNTAELGIVVERRIEIIRYQTAENRKRRERLQTVEELVERLTQAGGALDGHL